MNRVIGIIIAVVSFGILGILEGALELRHSLVRYGDEDGFYMLKVFIVNVGEDTLIVPTGYKEELRRPNHQEIIVYRFDLEIFEGRVIRRAADYYSIVNLQPGEVAELQNARLPMDSFRSNGPNELSIIYVVTEKFGEMYDTWIGRQTKVIEVK